MKIVFKALFVFLLPDLREKQLSIYTKINKSNQISVDHIEKPQKMVGSMVKYKIYMLMAVFLLDFFLKRNLLSYKGNILPLPENISKIPLHDLLKSRCYILWMPMICEHQFYFLLLLNISSNLMWNGIT